MDWKLRTRLQIRRLMFIDNQLWQFPIHFMIAEGDLESFRLDNKLIDISREGVLIQGKLEQIDAERTAILMQENYYRIS